MIWQDALWLLLVVAFFLEGFVPDAKPRHDFPKEKR